MESLVPSEIARLVYGYLIEENCEAAAQLFLETSSSLKECLVLQKKGRKFNTTVLGLSLVDILNLYTDAVCLVKNYLAREDSLNHALSEFVKELGNVLVIDHDSLLNISKTVFLRISVPNKKNSRRNSVHLESIEEEDEDEEEEKTEKETQKSEQKKSSSNEEPVPAKNTTISSSDEFDLNILQTLLDNTALHERLAENINKAIDSSGETSNHKTDEKKIIETILHNTEADPIFHELLDELVAPRNEDTTTPEDTDKENGDPAEERQAPNLDSGNMTTNEDPETSKKIEEQSNLAIEGILAGNKKMQEEKVDEEPQPTETIVISTPQAIATSSGIYKQSFIIPAGYTVTDVFPASQISTPLQPINVANVATFGHLSPILPQPAGVAKQSGSIRGGLASRRRRILPKQAATPPTESFYIQIPTQDDQVQEVKVDIPTPQKRMPEGIKGSRVRTRGGIQKVVGIRGVKAIVPQVVKPVDSSIHLLVSPGTVKKSNTTGIRTRAMSKKQENKPTTVKPSVPEVTVTQPSTNEEPQQAEVPKEKDSLSEKSKENPKEDDANEVTEATPQQQIIPKHPRMSLSTPRRTHVRVLDFETPDKSLTFRKSMTSPKVYHHQKKEPKALEFIKRGGMFSSPPKEVPKKDEKPEENKAVKGWDSDLRNFMASGENLDIPTSVGLKRKNGAKRDKSANTKRKVNRRRATKKTPVKKNSNEELVDQIEKEVRDVIGEEEMALNTSNNSELGNLIEQKLMEEMNKNDSTSSIELVSVEKPQSEASKDPDPPKETSKEIIEEVIRKDDEPKNSEPQVSNSEDCTMDADKHNEGSMSEEFNTSTPLKLTMSPVNENSRGQLTPTTKLMMSHLGKVSTRFPSVFSPTSQSSLENILIKECSRMETEKNTGNLAQDIEKLTSPKSGSCGNNPTPEDKEAESKKSTSEVGDKQLTFESVCKNSSNLFQTPAKFLSAPVPPGTPVEMTPLTKVLVSETSFAATVLVTPTLPPTPKIQPLVTPQKADDSPNGSIDLSGKETDKPQEDVISLNTNQEKVMNQENIQNRPLELDKNVTKPPILVTDCSKNISNEKPKDSNETSKQIETKTISNNVSEKQTCATPKIKLMSPKLSKTNEPLVRKKTGKVVEQRKSSEGNPSKNTQGLLKINSDSSFDGRVAEHVIDLEISNHSEQSENNKSSERTIEGKINKKQQSQETKKQVLSRKKTCLERNNKSLKKFPKQNIAKHSNKSSVEEEMESEIRHLLKDTKAKLFGPDNSSDSASDSSMNNDSELKKSNDQLKTARERLQKLVDIRMLNSSSTSDDSSDEETVIKPKVSEKDSKDGVPVKKGVHSNEEDGMECNSIFMKHSRDGFSSKKDDGSSTFKLIESSKVITREIEESCESFPTLHLSEESNQSLKLDSHSTKCQKPKKSPLSGNDPAGKKSSSSLLTTLSSRTNEQPDVEKAVTTKDPRKDSSTTPNQTEEKTNITVQPKNDHDLNPNERIFHIYSETVKSKFSDSEEKLHLARCQAVSEYLDNYIFTFTLNVDKTGNYMNKRLSSSPFLHIFEMSSTLSASPHSRIDERRIETPRTEQRIETPRTEQRVRPWSRTRNRKRNRSASSSEEEKDRRDHNRSYGSSRDGRVRERERDRFYRYRNSFDRRDSFPRKKYRDMRSHHDSRYRDYDHYSSYDKKRSRHSSPEPRKNIKKEDRRSFEEKTQSGKYKVYPNVNDSFTSSKSGSEVDGKHTDLNCTYSPERSFEAQKERCSTSSQRLVVDDQPSYSRPQPQPHSRASKPPSIREDGELSDSSDVKRISPERSRSAVLSLGAHDSRTKLLNKVDLDQFLSIVHGEED